MIERYNRVSHLREIAEKEEKKISQVVFEEQVVAMEQTPEFVYEEMKKCYDVMRRSIVDGFEENLRSTSGLTGGAAFRFKKYNESGKQLLGGIMGKAISYAISVSEFNAAMGKIVAAPTAGSCGILPAVLASMQETLELSEEEIVMSMFTASGVGMVIANCASLSGAEGGCQAECGSASAMAAAAIVELAGGTPEMAEHAVAIAIKNVLGLVCDPVAGLVEVPCVKRNAGGVGNAFVAAEMALAGLHSVIPADETIAAMKKVGDIMHPSLKETAQGGLATTPTGIRLFEEIFGEHTEGGCSGCRKCDK